MDLELLLIIFTVLLLLFFVISVLFFRAGKKVAGVIVAFFFWILFSSGGIICYYAFMPGNNNEGNDSGKIIKIKKGFNAHRTASLLKEKGIIRSTREFIITSYVFDFNRKIKAGKFKIGSRLSNYSILSELSSGKTVEDKITIPEGLTFDRVYTFFKDSLEADSLQFKNLVNDTAFIKSLGIDAANLEGYLFPETYYFPWGISEEEIIKNMVGEFNKVFNDSLRMKAQEMGFSIHEAVTLASIIEGEAQLDSERDKISAVFHNRLKKRMRLQADPTVQYIIQDGPRHLLLEDLKIESPYNTYLHRGLPPGPICNPGKKSIIAALYPSDENYLYFVARGDGSHIFSNTQTEHLKAKRNLDNLRRQLRNQKKQ